MNGRSTVRRVLASAFSFPSGNTRGGFLFRPAALRLYLPNFVSGPIFFGLNPQPQPVLTNLALDRACGMPRRLFAVDFNEGIARGGRSLRAPDQALESKDEGIHLWRTQRDLHRRSSKDSQTFQG